MLTFHFRCIGIVTHVTMKTYPLGQVWGGTVAYNNTYLESLMKAFAIYQSEGQLDTKSAVIANMVLNQNILLLTLVYLGPVERPAAFQPFYDIPALSDQAQLQNNFRDLVGPPLAVQLPR